MTESRFLSRRSFVAVAAAAAGTLALGLVGCGEDDKGEAAKADRADAAIDWQFMTADELAKKLDAGDPVIVLDIRPDDMYNNGHIKGAYHVASFPVENEEQEKALQEAAKNLGGDDPIVIICKTGNKGAKRAVSVLEDEGIAADRLFILEGGGDGWNVAEWTTTDNDSTTPSK